MSREIEFNIRAIVNGFIVRDYDGDYNRSEMFFSTIQDANQYLVNAFETKIAQEQVRDESPVATPSV